MEKLRSLELRVDKALINERGEVDFKFRYEVLDLESEFVKEEDLDLRWLQSDGSDPSIVPLSITPVTEAGAVIIRDPKTGRKIRYRHDYYTYPYVENEQERIGVNFRLSNSLAGTCFCYDDQGRLRAVMRSDDYEQTTGCVFYDGSQITGGQLLIGPFEPGKIEGQKTVRYDENLREKERLEGRLSTSEKGSVLELVSQKVGQEPRIILERPMS